MRKISSVLTVLFCILLVLVPASAEGNGYINVDKVISCSNTALFQPATYLIDGNPNTYWGFQQDSTNGWAEILLEDESLIYGLQLKGDLSSGTILTIEYLHDGLWQQFLGAAINHFPNDGVIDLSFDRVITDKLRLRLSGIGTSDTKIFDVKVLGEGRNKVLHRIEPRSINSSENTIPVYPVTHLVDGNTNSMWKTESSKGEVLFELEEGFSLTNINIFFTEESRGSFTIDAYVNEKWQTIAVINEILTPGWNRIDTDRQGIQTSQLRIAVSGLESELGGISQVELWGHGLYTGNHHQILLLEPHELRSDLNLEFELELADEKEVLPYIAEKSFKVFYKNNSLPQFTNSIHQNLRLVNTGDVPLDLSQIKLRYWYTKEPDSSEDAHIYWSNIGQDNIRYEFATLNNELAEADSYFELGFTGNAGLLGPSMEVEINLSFNTTDWQEYDQLNDYSFLSHARDYVENPYYTGYLGGSLYWGEEPTNDMTSTYSTLSNLSSSTLSVATPMPLSANEINDRLKVLYKAITTSHITNNIQQNVKIVNASNDPIDLSTVTLRYWYTDEPFRPQEAEVYWSSLGQHITTEFFELETRRPGADQYLELGFDELAGTLAPKAEVEIMLGFHALDWANYNQENDYSFNPNATIYQENNKFTAYLNDKLIWGNEPERVGSATLVQPTPDYYLDVVAQGIIDHGVTIELNGNLLTLTPTAYLSGQTIFSQLLSKELLWDGVNYLRINSVIPSLTINGMQITERTKDGEQELLSKELNNRLLLTASSIETDHILQLQEKTHIEEIQVFAGQNASFYLYAWCDDEWLELPINEQHLAKTTFKGLIETEQLRLINAGYSPVNEVRVLGGVITDRAPVIKILWPFHGEVVELNNLDDKRLIGFIDNPLATVSVNGRVAQIDGHYFSVKLSQLGLIPNKVNKLTVVAEDELGRVTSKELSVVLGNFFDYTLDQADEIIYTEADSFRISGSIVDPQVKVEVNENHVSIIGGSFSTDVSLKEGLNRIKIRFSSENNGFTQTIYRTVVKGTEDVQLTIDSPINDSYIATDTIIVTGRVTFTGQEQPKVIVNGSLAKINRGTYRSAPIALDEGNNVISVQAITANGRIVDRQISVTLDTVAPIFVDVLPENGHLSIDSLLEVIGAVQDKSPVRVYVNGVLVDMYDEQFSHRLGLEDGIHSISLTAQDLAGNTGDYFITDVMVDTSPPLPFEIRSNVEGWTNNNSPVFTFQTDDLISGISHYELAINDGEFGKVTSPYQLELSDGEHLITVKAVDLAGWETTSSTKVFIDTTPPLTPEHFRVIPGNGRMVVKWDPSCSDIIEYHIRKDKEEESHVVSVEEFRDLNLRNGSIHGYQLWAVDRAGNISEPTDWKEATVGLAKEAYAPEQGALVEYETATLVIPESGLPEGVVEIQVSEISSDYLGEKGIYPFVGPIHEFSAVVEDGAESLETTSFEQGFLGSIKYDPDLIPEGFPEQNLGVYYYDSMFDQWLLIETSGVDVENNTIYFMTNHFSSFSVQASLIQDLSPQEYKDAGYSPLTSYVDYEGVKVSPQGGTASTNVTELVLPGKNGFDLVLERRYDTATARRDAFGLGINGKLGFNLLGSNGKLLELVEVQNNVSDWIDNPGEALSNSIVKTIEQYLLNQGDYSYSMGQGWRLNIPYISEGNGTMMLITAEGAMHSINEMKIVDASLSPLERTLGFEQHEGDDFTLHVNQVVAHYPIEFPSKDMIFKTRWQSLEYRLVMKDGTIYEMDGLGRTTKVVDPSGLNEINFHYSGLFLDNIVDSMGRVVRFEYETGLFMPRIKRMYVENDPYNRDIRYSIGDNALLESAIDAGGRRSDYSYDTKLLFGGEAGVTVNIVSLLVEIIAPKFSGLASAIFGDSVELYGNLQAQVVFPIKEMRAPGQGVVELRYDTPTIVYGEAKADWFLFIPVSATFSLNLQQRLLADRVRVKDNSGSVVYTANYDYDIDYFGLGQPLIRKTIVDDGKTKTAYHYSAVEKQRFRWEDKSGKASIDGKDVKFWFPMQLWRWDVLSLNTKTEIFDAKTNALLETRSTKYNNSTMRPLQDTIKRGSNTRTLNYTYDNWGNVIYTKDFSQGNGRENTIESWMYYLNTDSKGVSEAQYKSIPFTQTSVKSERKNLLVGSVVADKVPDGSGGYSTNRKHLYNQYDSIGQLVKQARWSGSEWLTSEFAYDLKHGSITESIDPEGHKTVYEYDNHGLLSAIIEKAVVDADGNYEDIALGFGHEYISGWKLWGENPRGFRTEYQYDSLGRITKITEADEKGNNPVTTIEYNDKDLYSITIDPLLNKTKYDYDDFGQLIEQIRYRSNDSVAAKTSLRYDPWGNVIAVTDPNNQTTNYEYDALGHNTKITYPSDTNDRSEKSMVLNYNTNTLTIIDENGNRTVAELDMHGRTVKTSFYDDYERLIKEEQHFFDGYGNEVLSIDPKGSKTRQVFNSLNLPEKVVLPEETVWENGRSLQVIPEQSYEYNKAGHKIAEIISLPNGKKQRTDFDVDGLGRVIKVTSPYSEDGETKQAVTLTYYDGNSNVIREVDANNSHLPKAEQKAFIYTYTAKDLLATETDPAGSTISYSYDAVGNQISMTDPRGNSGNYNGDFTILYEYDELARLVKGHLPTGLENTTKPVVQLEYDARGNLIKRTEPDGGITEFTYTPRNLVAKEITKGAGKSYTTEFFYDAAGNQIGIKDPKGNLTGQRYDGLNRLIRIIYPAGNMEEFVYDANDNQVAHYDGINWTEFTYDRYNRLIEQKDALNNTTKYRYDRWGNMTQMQNALGHTYTYSYDELQRLTEEVDSLGSVQSYSYDPVGNRSTATDRNGTEYEYQYYSNNLVQAITLVNGAQRTSLSYKYDEAGFPIRIKSADVITENNIFDGVYRPDPYGRILRESKIINDQSFSVDYGYDVMGRLTQMRYPNGEWTTFEYNNLGELIKVPGFIEEAPIYDQNGFLEQVMARSGITNNYEYDLNNRLNDLSYTNQTEIIKGYGYSYDNANNITEKADQISTIDGIRQFTNYYYYDPLNQLTTARLSGEFEIGPDELALPIGRSLDDYFGINTLDFDLAETELIELDYAAGSIGVSLESPIAYPVTKIELTPKSPVHRVHKDSLRVFYGLSQATYTEATDLTVEATKDGGIRIILNTPINARFVKVQNQFDDRDQNFDPVNLAQFVNNAEDLIKVYYLYDRRIENYSYDAGGNRITESIEQRENQTKDYIYYPNSNRLMTNDKFAFVYDATGNLIEKGSSYTLRENNSKVSINPNEGEHWRYHYDLLNRLVKVEQNGEVVANYKYDEAGLRLSKQTKEQTTYYIFNLNGQVIYEQEDTDYTEYLYVFNRHFARIDGNLITEERKTYFYHTDHLGSTVLVTDELGQTVWSSEYTPFGQITKDDPGFNKAIKFTGKDLDPDTGLYYFNARWYDSDIGRFISEDPIKDGLNWYTYAISNPLRFVDPTGLSYKDFLTELESQVYVGTPGLNTAYRDYLAGIEDGVYSDISSAQASLVIIGYDLGTFGSRQDGIDGQMGQMTTKSLMKFQRAAGLEPTGQLDMDTVVALEYVVASGIGKSNVDEIAIKLGHIPSRNTFITAEVLNALGWGNVTDAKIIELNNTLGAYNINTRDRIMHFISQVTHESARGRYTKELASGLEYEDRIDLGNIYVGDGPKYKGAGYLQLTGRYNYQKFSEAIGDPRVMEGVEYVAIIYPWTSAGFWWDMNRMNRYVDSGASVEQVTKRVNGGYNGLAERQRYYDLLNNLLP